MRKAEVVLHRMPDKELLDIFRGVERFVAHIAAARRDIALFPPVYYGRIGTGGRYVLFSRMKGGVRRAVWQGNSRKGEASPLS